MSNSGDYRDNIDVKLLSMNQDTFTFQQFVEYKANQTPPPAAAKTTLQKDSRILDTERTGKQTGNLTNFLNSDDYSDKIDVKLRSMNQDILTFASQVAELKANQTTAPAAAETDLQKSSRILDTENKGKQTGNLKNFFNSDDYNDTIDKTLRGVNHERFSFPFPLLTEQRMTHHQTTQGSETLMPKESKVSLEVGDQSNKGGHHQQILEENGIDLKSMSFQVAEVLSKRPKRENTYAALVGNAIRKNIKEISNRDWMNNRMIQDYIDCGLEIAEGVSLLKIVGMSTEQIEWAGQKAKRGAILLHLSHVLRQEGETLLDETVDMLRRMKI